MYDAFCDRCDAVVLLGPRRIVSLENTDDGIALTFRCYCGAVGTEVVGRAASRRAAESEARSPARTADGRQAPSLHDEAGVSSG